MLWHPCELHLEFLLYVNKDERYLCTENYSPQNTDEVALEKGTVVDVLEKNLDGWWFVR